MKKILWLIGIVFLSLSLQAQAKGNKVSPNERMQEWCQRDHKTQQASMLDAVRYYKKKGLFIPEIQKGLEKDPDRESVMATMANSLSKMMSSKLCNNPEYASYMGSSVKRFIYGYFASSGMILKDQEVDDNNNFWF